MFEAGGTILLDISEAEMDTFDRSLLERMGHPVVVCHGPGEGRCPLLVGPGCDKVTGVHGIVFHLDLDNPKHRAILRRYQKVVRPEVPIRAVVKPGQAERYDELLAGVEVWTHEPTAGELDAFAAQVEAADRLGEAAS